MPIAGARALSVAGEGVAKITRRPPLIPRGTLHFLESHPVPVAAAAGRDLGWEARPFEPSLVDVLEQFRTRGWV
jgi:dihydroflavonol-4-reductase